MNVVELPENEKKLLSNIEKSRADNLETILCGKLQGLKSPELKMIRE